MKLDQLKPTTRKTYNFITKFIALKGYAPTIREIRDGIEVSSTSVASYHRDILVRKGLITFDPERTRSIEIAGAITLTFYGDDAKYLRKEFGETPELGVMDLLRQEVGVIEHGS